MGGDITVKSEFGKGTTFFIQFNAKVVVPKKELEKYQFKDLVKSLSELSNKSRSEDRNSSFEPINRSYIKTDKN